MLGWLSTCRLPMTFSSGSAFRFRPLAMLLSFSSLSPNTQSCLVAVFYGVCSISLNFLNKAVVSSYQFNFPYFIMVCQMTTTILILDGLRHWGHLPNLPDYSWKEGRTFFPASLCFALHATLSLSALHGMNIPMYGAIKRCTPLVSLVLSVLVLKKPVPSRLIIFSILTITVGCLVAGIGDLEFDQHAYIMGTLSVFAQGGYLTLVQKCAETKKSTLEMIHLNSYNTLPFFLIMSLFLREPLQISGCQSLNDPSFYVTFVILILSGCILTYAQFLCASICSALTASLVGVAKSVLQTTIGFFTFGGVKFHPLNILGLVLNTLGACVYSYVKYQEGQYKRNTFHHLSSSVNLVKSAIEDEEKDIESEPAEERRNSRMNNGYVLVGNQDMSGGAHFRIESESTTHHH